MEFFQTIKNTYVHTDELKKLLSINSLPVLCASIDTMSAKDENTGDIYCVWGSFDVRREEIRYGVRFSLLNCPHALAWTITFDEIAKHIVIHCTIDKTEQDEDFVDSIDIFVKEWASGIAGALQ